jgi:hypothetical protein
MPGFDTLGARLARSRRRLERERAAANVEEPAQDGRDIARRREGVPACLAASATTETEAAVPRHDR